MVQEEMRGQRSNVSKCHVKINAVFNYIHVSQKIAGGVSR